MPISSSESINTECLSPAPVSSSESINTECLSPAPISSLEISNTECLSPGSSVQHISIHDNILFDEIISVSSEKEVVEDTSCEASTSRGLNTVGDGGNGASDGFNSINRSASDGFKSILASSTGDSSTCNALHKHSILSSFKFVSYLCFLFTFVPYLWFLFIKYGI